MGATESTVCDTSDVEVDPVLGASQVRDKLVAYQVQGNTANNRSQRNLDVQSLLAQLKSKKQNTNDDITPNETQDVLSDVSMSDDDLDQGQEGALKRHCERVIVKETASDHADIFDSAVHPIRIRGNIFVGEQLEVEDLSLFRIEFPITKIKWTLSDNIEDDYSFSRDVVSTVSVVQLRPSYVGYYIQCSVQRTVKKALTASEREADDFVDIYELDKTFYKTCVVRSNYTVGPVALNLKLIKLPKKVQCLSLKNLSVLKEELLKYSISEAQMGESALDGLAAAEIEVTEAVLGLDSLSFQSSNLLNEIASNRHIEFLKRFTDKHTKTLGLDLSDVELYFYEPCFTVIKVTDKELHSEQAKLYVKLDFYQWATIALWKLAVKSTKDANRIFVDAIISQKIRIFPELKLN